MEELISRWSQLAAGESRGCSFSVRMAVGEIGPDEVWSSINTLTLRLNPEGTVSWRNPRPLFDHTSLEIDISRGDQEERKWQGQLPYAVEFAEVDLPQ